MSKFTLILTFAVENGALLKLQTIRLPLAIREGHGFDALRAYAEFTAVMLDAEYAGIAYTDSKEQAWLLVESRRMGDMYLTQDC